MQCYAKARSEAEAKTEYNRHGNRDIQAQHDHDIQIQHKRGGHSTQPILRLVAVGSPVGSIGLANGIELAIVFPPLIIV